MTGCAVYSNSGLLHVAACSEVDAGVETGGSLLSAHLFLLFLRHFTNRLYSWNPAMHFV